MSIVSCSQSGFVSDYCLIAQPIYLDVAEVKVLSRETKTQILVHNETWAQKCSSLPDSEWTNARHRISFGSLVRDYKYTYIIVEGVRDFK